MTRAVKFRILGYIESWKTMVDLDLKEELFDTLLKIYMQSIIFVPFLI